MIIKSIPNFSKLSFQFKCFEYIWLVYFDNICNRLLLMIIIFTFEKDKSQTLN